MTELGCEQLRGCAAELALGVLPGREWAAAVEHLEGCPECRSEVEQLALVGDRLLRLAPLAEPPVGFESRVVQRLGRTPSRAAPLRRRWASVVAAGTIAAAGLGGWAIGTANDSGTPGHAASQLMSGELTAGHTGIGSVFLHPGDPAWVFMTVDHDGASTGYLDNWVTCELTLDKGPAVRVGTFQLTGGYGYWGAPVHVASTSVTGARLVSPNGTVLATASIKRS